MVARANAWCSAVPPGVASSWGLEELVEDDDPPRGDTLVADGDADFRSDDVPSPTIPRLSLLAVINEKNEGIGILNLSDDVSEKELDRRKGMYPNS